MQYQLKAVVIRKHGGPEVLSYETVSKPNLKTDEALIKVNYCGVNHLDIWVRNGIKGRKVTFPHILGCDVSGTLLESFGDFKKGDEVVVYPALKSKTPRISYGIIGGFGGYEGGYAEFIAIPKINIVKKPDYFTSQEGAAMNISYLTSWNILQRSGCKKGDTILIWGANSGVGSSSILLAKAIGINVIAVASNKNKIKFAEKIGADYVIDRASEDVTSKVLQITNQEGVKAVIDHVGTKTWPTSLEVLRIRGTMICCGTTSGAEGQVSIRAFYSKEAKIIGAYLGTKSQLVSLHKFMQMKKIKPIIDSAYKLKNAKEAHEKMEKSLQLGKILLRIS